ncbi:MULTISPECIES: hypothetical protein [unclassified Microbulbifer]|uniref:hypothetical protein n=1 Tax=unclassified Microbulbifer TaxID=2619833 RepID=UPI0027E49D20|nr:MULTISPECIES: hypothetical protein [unclassified Microbulbifer]
MAQRRPFNLHRWQAVLLLAVFLAVRGLVPAGFMPAPLAGGAPYGYCHGDSRSALLLELLAPRHNGHHHPAGHQHDAPTAQSFADNHCSFSTVATAAVTGTAEVFAGIAGISPSFANPTKNSAQRHRYFLPPERAPPNFLYL